MEGVLPGVGPFDVPSLACLDRRLLPLVRDAAVQVAFVEQGARLVRVVAGVQVHGDVVGQRSQAVQGRGEQRGVVTVRSSQHAAQRDSITIRHAQALQALFAAIDR
jgi:hypothetical protein